MASIIVAGATGAIGRTVVQCAIQQPSIHTVVALTRSKEIGIEHYEHLFGVVTQPNPATAAASTKAESREPTAESCTTEVDLKSTPDLVYVTAEQSAKIKPITMDWEAFAKFWASTKTGEIAEVDLMSEYKDIFGGHTYAAMCLGAPRKVTVSSAEFTRCDYDYVIAFTEAILTFSAPKAFDAEFAYVHQMNDHGEVHKHHPDAETKTTPGPAIMSGAMSSATLKVLCQVSASIASSNGMIHYMKTKGDAEEAVVERVHRHNTAITANTQVHPLLLLLLRPGLLGRHSKARLNEKIAQLLVSSLPVETCGAAIVDSFVEPIYAAAAEEQGKTIVAEQQPITAATAAAPAADGGAAGSPNASTSLNTSAMATSVGGDGLLHLAHPFVATKAMVKGGFMKNTVFPMVYELPNGAIREMAERLPKTAAPPAA